MERTMFCLLLVPMFERLLDAIEHRYECVFDVWPIHQSAHIFWKSEMLLRIVWYIKRVPNKDFNTKSLIYVMDETDTDGVSSIPYEIYIYIYLYAIHKPAIGILKPDMLLTAWWSICWNHPYVADFRQRAWLEMFESAKTYSGDGNELVFDPRMQMFANEILVCLGEVLTVPMRKYSVRKLGVSEMQL